MLRSFLVALWLTSPIWAQSVPVIDPATLAEITSAASVQSVDRSDLPKEVELGSLIRVPLDKGERAFIFSQLGAVDVERTYTGLVFTGKPGLYIVHIFDLNDPDQIIPESYSVTIVGGPIPPGPVPPGPNPGPTPGPTPVIPTGFAGEVYQKAIAVGDKANCLRVLNNYQTVRGMVAGNSNMTFGQGAAELLRLNQALQLPKDKWTTFAVWIGQQMNARTKNETREELIAVCDEIITGLEAAAQ